MCLIVVFWVVNNDVEFLVWRRGCVMDPGLQWMCLLLVTGPHKVCLDHSQCTERYGTEQNNIV